MYAEAVLGRFHLDDGTPIEIIFYTTGRESAIEVYQLWLGDWTYLTTLCSDTRKINLDNTLTGFWLNKPEVYEILNDPVTQMLIEVFDMHGKECYNCEHQVRTRWIRR